MSFRTVLITKPAKLSFKDNYLLIRGDETNMVHLSEINTILLESQMVQITSRLLNEIINFKIKLIICDERHNPSGELVPYNASFNSTKKIINQTQWQEIVKQTIWTHIIANKIKNQATLLKNYNYPGADKLYTYISELELNDESNREGHAAKVYFNRLFGMNFTRTDKDNAINSALNYGYSLLLSIVAREVVSNGYLTQLGIHHDNMFNDLNLACDFMEPFRPFIDLLCAKMNPEAFGKDQKLELIGFMNRQIIIAGKQQYMLNAIEIYVKSLFISLETGYSSLIKFPEYEFPIYESTGIL